MRPASSRRRLGALLVLGGTLLALLLPSFALAAPLAGSGATPSGIPAQTAPTTPTVTWNGVNVNSAGSASSAFTITFNQAITVNYSWSPTAYPGVNDARLQMLYFGFPISTRDVPPVGNVATATSATMSWTVGALQYVFEGVFGITASLLNGSSTLWSENFYVRLVAPFSILSALPILLLVIGLYEVYALARSGRQAGIRKKAAATPAPATADSSAPTAPAATPPSGASSDSAPPATAPESPPPGGTS
jgi:hypothetical protein